MPAPTRRAHAGVSGADRLEVHHAGAQPGAPSRRQGRLLAGLHAPARASARIACSRRCSRPTTARAFRRRGSRRPTLRSASPGRSSPTPPRCRPGARADVEEQKAALTRCVDHGRRAYGYEARSYPRRCLPRLQRQRRRLPAGRDRRPPLLGRHGAPRGGRHRGAAPRPRPAPRGGAGRG